MLQAAAAAAAAVTGDGGITDKERIGKSMEKSDEDEDGKWIFDLDFLWEFSSFLIPSRFDFTNEFTFYTLKRFKRILFFFK